MKIGISTGSLHTFDFEILKKLCKSFDHVEILLEFPLTLDFVESNLNKIKKIIADYGRTVSFHAPVVFINLGYPVSSFRNFSTKILIKSLNLLEKIGGTHLNFHMGSLKYLPKRFQRNKKLQRLHEKRCIEQLEKLVKRCKESLLTVENDLKESIFTTPSIFNKIFNTIDSPLLKLTLDVTHAYGCGKEKLIRNFLTRNSIYEKIHALHLSDGKFSGKFYNEHLPIGEGEINFSQIFSLLKSKKFKNLVIIETNGTSYKKILTAKKLLIEFWKKG